MFKAAIERTPTTVDDLSHYSTRRARREDPSVRPNAVRTALAALRVRRGLSVENVPDAVLALVAFPGVDGADVAAVAGQSFERDGDRYWGVRARSGISTMGRCRCAA
jgi:hypothetical protein